MDPVTLGLCSQIDLDFEVGRAAKDKPQAQPADSGQTLLPAEITTAVPEPASAESVASMEAPRRPGGPQERIDVDSVFAKLKQLRTPAGEDE
jgi:hypothetical protein